jgi:hypothetical protein
VDPVMIKKIVAIHNKDMKTRLKSGRIRKNMFREENKLREWLSEKGLRMKTRVARGLG